MNFENLRVFEQVAEHGSLTKAAVALDSLQPVVSRKISALERECGGRLFDRTGRGLVLTEFGKRILVRVKSLMEEAEQLSLEMKAGGGVVNGEVRLGILPSLTDPAVYSLYRRVRDLFPGIVLHVMEGSTGQIDEWLTTGRIDIAIRFRYNGTAGRNESTLGEVGTCLVSAPGDAITKKGVVEFAELDGLPLVLPGIPNVLRAALDQMAKKNRIHLSVIMEADSLVIQKRMAAAGDAYAVLATHAVLQEVSAGVLQVARLVNPSLERYIELATTTQRPLSQAGREVARLIRLIFEERFATIV